MAHSFLVQWKWNIWKLVKTSGTSKFSHPSSVPCSVGIERMVGSGLHLHPPVRIKCLPFFSSVHLNKSVQDLRNPDVFPPNCPVFSIETRLVAKFSVKATAYPTDVPKPLNQE